MDYDQSKAIKVMDCNTIREMSPRSFQQQLRSQHIIIADCNLPHISCDRHGLTSLNGLKEVVNVEGRCSCK